MAVRGKRKFADILLYCKPSIPICVVEAKDNNHAESAELQQSLGYAETLDLPVAISSNGDSFVIQYRKNCGPVVDRNPLTTEVRPMESFPTYEEIWACYCRYNGLETPESKSIAVQDYYYDSTGMSPRYYQSIAINRTVEAIANGQNRILLVMATGLYPCPEALLVLVLATSLSMIGAGICAVSAMSAGMSIPIIACGYAAWLGRTGLFTAVKSHEKTLRLISSIVELVGFLFLLSFALYTAWPFIVGAIKQVVG